MTRSIGTRGAMRRWRAPRRLDRPLFFSSGIPPVTGATSWRHESFEDAAVAEVMNGHFVNVKVDREERPDVDAVYMEAVQAATGRGGWPMSVFATPEGLPFYAGTYFPDRARHGMPAFGQVVGAVIDAWKKRRDEIDDQARALAGAVSEAARAARAAGQPRRVRAVG